MRNILKKGLSLLIAAALLVGLLQPEVSYAASASTYYIKVNRQQNCVTVYEKDSKGNYTVPVRAMVCSTGANKATPAGKFRLGGKYRWHELDGPVYGQYCSRITGHVLFHSVYYSITDPSTLSYSAYNKLGSAVSHGCVRLSVEDAKWIYDNCPSGTVVEIYDSSDPGPLGKPTPIKIDPSSPYRGWDPTDPNPNNPWPESVKNPKKEDEKPKLKGVKNKTIERCSKKSALTDGVSAVDSKGKKLKVKVSGKYDLNKAGKYKVTYSATDANGKKTSKKVTITVKDTKAPTLTLSKSKVTISDEKNEFTSLSNMKSYFRKLASAKDSGEALEAKYIKVDADALWEAWLESKSGTYKVKIYAKDKAGNKSKTKTVTVTYKALGEEEPEEPEEPDTPDTPDIPDNPDTPDTPDSPDTPDNPSDPANPGTADTPGTPSDAGTGDTSGTPGSTDTSGSTGNPDSPGAISEQDSPGQV